MKIQYNPLVAASILFACLTYLWEKEQGNEDLKFEANLEAVGSPAEFWKEKKGQGQSPSSVFNQKQMPLLIWACENNDWEKDTSANVQLAIVHILSVLNSTYCTFIGFKMSGQSVIQREHLAKLAELGEQLKDCPYLGLLELESNHDRVIKFVNATLNPKKKAVATEAPKIEAA